MSIIYDALKKAEKVINPNQKATPDTQDKHPKSKYKLYILYALVGCLGLAIGNIIFGFLSPPKTSDLAKNDRATKPTETSRAIQAKPVAAPPKTTPSIFIGRKEKTKVSLILNGVFFSEGEGYALINNRIIKEGEEIDGLIVTRVNLDEVELVANDGSTIKLHSNVR